jgi:hypothetical protein
VRRALRVRAAAAAAATGHRRLAASSFSALELCFDSLDKRVSSRACGRGRVTATGEGYGLRHGRRRITATAGVRADEPTDLPHHRGVLNAQLVVAAAAALSRSANAMQGKANANANANAHSNEADVRAAAAATHAAERTGDRSRARRLRMAVTVLGPRSKRHAAGLASLGGCLLEFTLAPRELRGERLRANAAAHWPSMLCCNDSGALWAQLLQHVALCVAARYAVLHVCAVAAPSSAASAEDRAHARLHAVVRSSVLCVAAAVCRTSCRSGA